MDNLKEYLVKELDKTPNIIRDRLVNVKNARVILSEIKYHANNFISDNPNHERLIIMRGLRGIGKTTILFQLYDFLIQKKEVDINSVLYVSVDRMQQFSTARRLVNYIEKYIEIIHNSSLATLNKKIFLLLDEVHFEKEWGQAIKTLYDISPQLFIVSTGSSAPEMKTGADIARRGIEFSLFPLNFLEYELLKNEIDCISNLTTSFSSLMIKSDLSMILKLNQHYANFKEKIKSKKIDFDIEVEKYIQIGSFTRTLKKEIINDSYTLSNNRKNIKESNDKINSSIVKTISKIVTRTIELDILSFLSLNRETLKDIKKIVMMLSIKKPGETAQNKLASNLDIPIRKVSYILEALEKSGLIFSVKPFAKSGNNYARTPWKYYFISASILHVLQTTSAIPQPEGKGLLLETAVASSLFRIVQTNTFALSLLYDTNKNSNVDFLLVSTTGKVIPVECGFNKKENQIKNAMKLYKSDIGFIVTNTDKIKFSNDIITIPYPLLFMA